MLNSHAAGWRKRIVMASVVMGLCAAGTAQQPGFYLVGESPGTDFSWVWGFTLDGGLGVGTTERTSGATPVERGYRWTAEQGRMDAIEPGLRAFHSFTGVSSDGSVIVGFHSATFPGTSNSQAFILREGQPLFSLPILATYATCVVPVKVSGDGSMVAGTCHRSGIPVESRGFRWTATTGTLVIPPARTGDTISVVNAISRDGTTIVGKSGNSSLGTSEGFVWRSATGARPLASPFGSSAAYDVSANGSIIVGEYHTLNGVKACYWDAHGVHHDLGSLDGSTDQVARCVSADGSIIAGEAGGHSPEAREGVVWTEATGMIWARDYFRERGAPLPTGYRAYSCGPISGDGKSFGVRVFPPSGAAANISGIAVIGPRCPADFNRDGGVDGMDVEAFFADWADALPDADVNEDGGVDGSDVEYFFGAWEAGGC